MANESTPFATILNTTDEAFEGIVKTMSSFPLFDGMTNEDKMLFALALGYHEGLKPELKRPRNLTRAEYLSDKFKAVANAINLADAGFENTEVVRDRKAASSLVERYDNGGFQLLEGEVTELSDAEAVADDYVARMDEMYEEYTGEKID